MDVRDLALKDNSFDVAIDKGTMDAMMTAKGDVWVRPRCASRTGHIDTTAHRTPRNKLLKTVRRRWTKSSGKHE